MEGIIPASFLFIIFFVIIIDGLTERYQNWKARRRRKWRK